MVESFEIENKVGLKIRGIINKPEGQGKFPCLVYCHGFTGHKLETHAMFVKIARMLEKQNVVSIRFDFTGSGESDGEFRDMSMTTEIEDCEEVLKFCSTLSFVDKDNINILGFSMGGAIAVVNSVINLNLIKNTILISPAVNMYGLVVSQIKGERLHKLYQDKVVNFDGYLLSEKAIDDIFNYKIFDYAKEIKQNTLIIHGTCDESVAPLYSEKLQEIIGDNARLVYINGASHCYYEIDEQNQLLNHILDFCKSNIVELGFTKL